MNILRHPATARVAPFAIYIVFLPIGQALGGLYPSADLRWVYAVQVGLTALALAILWKRYGELHVLAAVGVRDVLIATTTGIVVFILWTNLDHPLLLLGDMGAGFDPRYPDGSLNPAFATVRVVGAALVVPIMEELFWRSFLSRWVDSPSFLELPPQRISFKAVALTSLLFAVEHTLWFAGWLAGIAYVLLYRRSGNLWVPVISHTITNGALAMWVLHTGNWQFW